MDNNVKKMAAIIATVGFMIAWIYVVLMENMKYGKVVAVLGFLLMIYIVLQIKNPENRDKTYFGLFIGNLIMIMTLTAQFR